MSHNITPVLLVGAGPMAVAYAQVLKAQQIPFVVTGRSEASAQKFREQTGVDVRTGGLAAYLQQHAAPQKAIVATGVEALEENAVLLLQAGCPSLLVEKPGALHLCGIQRIAALAEQKKADVYIAYNRRYYASVERAKQMIAEDGGLREIYFEFTEWGHVIEPLQKAPGVKEHWFLANSTHVVDLAFHLAGLPKDWKAWTAGGSSWHPSATRFVGSGLTERNVLFTYQADWEGPGRWGLELVTSQRRLYLRPVEKLSVQEKGSVHVVPVEINDTLDLQFKPGLFRQVAGFLHGNPEAPCGLQEHVQAMPFYLTMANYLQEL